MYCDMTYKLNTCHRYELLAVRALGRQRRVRRHYSIIGLPRASQTTSVPHQIHKRFPHVSTPHPHFARKQPCQNFSSCTRCKTTPRVSVRAKITGTSFVRPIQTFHFLGPFRKSPAPRLARSESVTIYEEPQQYSTSAQVFLAASRSWEGRGVSLIIEYLTSFTGSKRLNEREIGSYDLYRQVFN